METPDGAWAWIIAGAACIINMLLSGLSRMIGMLYMAIMSNFNVTRSEAALPFVVRNSIRMLMGIWYLVHLAKLSRMIGMLYMAIMSNFNVTRSEAALPLVVRNSIRMLMGIWYLVHLAKLSRMIGMLYMAIMSNFNVTRSEAALPLVVRNSIRMLMGIWYLVHLAKLSRMIGMLYMAIMSNFNVTRSEAALPLVVRNSIRMLMGIWYLVHLAKLSRMIGMLYMAIMSNFNVTRSEAALPFVVRNSIRMLMGPLVGIIGQRYGIRTVTFCGGMLAAVGAALCSIAPDVTWLAIFWGGLHGIGFAFANTLFQVVVNQYFEKYRATASGIALSGACVGSLGFPIMIESILDSYGLAGGFLLLGGVVLHVLPPSLLLKSPPWVTHPEKYARQLALQKSKQAIKPELQRQKNDIQIHDDFNCAKQLIPQASFSSNPVEELVYVNRNYLGDPIGVFQPLKGNESWETKEELRAVCILYRVTKTPTMKIKQLDEISPPLERKSSITGGKIPTVSERISDVKSGAKSSHKNQTKPAKLKASGNEQSFLQSIQTIGTLYTNPVYILISICMSTYVIIFIPIVTVIVDYSTDKGISESYGKYLINALAIGDLIGRLCFGWVTDKGLMTIPSFMTTMMVLQGLFIALFPFSNSLYTFMMALILYGMTSGSMLVLFPVLVLKYVEIKKQAVAIACVGFLSGLVSFSIPPLIGHFRDKVGSYDGMFYLTGGISILSGGLWLLEPVVVKLYYGDDYQEKINRNNYFQNTEGHGKETKPSS